MQYNLGVTHKMKEILTETFVTWIGIHGVGVFVFFGG